MSCPICSHTMQNLGTEGKKTYWCPRCGTIKTVAPGGFEEKEVTSLVRRTISILGLTEGLESRFRNWIMECVLLPEQR